MTQFDFSEKILELLQEKKYPQLQKYLETLNPADIAEYITDLQDDGELEDSDLLRLFRLLPKEQAADTFAEMDPDLQEKLEQKRRADAENVLKKDAAIASSLQ